MIWFQDKKSNNFYSPLRMIVICCWKCQMIVVMNSFKSAMVRDEIPVKFERIQIWKEKEMQNKVMFYSFYNEHMPPLFYCAILKFICSLYVSLFV